jgi:hypothetical protein
MRATLFGIVLVVLLGGGLYPEDRDGGKSFKPAHGQAGIYIARKSETLGALIDFQVVLDGDEVVKLKGGTYAFLAVKPGTHKIEIKGGVGSAVIEVKAGEGKNYFFETGAKPKKALLEPEISQVILEPMGQLMVSQSKWAKPDSK